MLLRVVSFIIPFVMLFIGFEICNLDDNNVLLGVKFPKIQEVPIALKEYKKLFRAYLVIFWAIINSIIMVVNISVREGYIPLMIILTIIIDGIIIIFVHYIINTKLKALKHREGWEKLIYNNPTFVDRKSGESLTVDDSDYIFGIFYFKPKDSSFLVAKRNGKGININWGNIIGKCIGIAIIVAIIACVSSVAYISISLNNTTTLNLVLENENVVINGTYGELLPYKEMTTVEYLDKIPKVEMNLDGVKSGNSYFGIYYIEGVGRAKLYVEDINEPVVKILTNGYLPVYINYQKLSSTQWLYNSVGSRRNNIYKT
ncbi:MAG: PH domain-containing protein [Sarcina ventriculi]|uniref:Predicted membrane protein n=1 Tax=Sarcina ventriculi TaxID=1267 RepID=A0ABP2AVC7_SARVE|nr:PH domain-containing protein [Sarcina ventriculi]MDO4401780.1 PH domain-containing protein [Clostridiaceae bacterium]MBU5323077.1 hypothetical protein [Sarcina ventriculi]MCI5635377.1 PH domain-containing protein [Sarcina ventriculi]MDD7373776.1 PH domain-containing protein [Sarcina ventriculi]MDY7061887.1 PH domain-containing protein [Sarcina ventriculi]